jgi:hypothetical protein
MTLFPALVYGQQGGCANGGSSASGSAVSTSAGSTATVRSNAAVTSTPSTVRASAQIQAQINQLQRTQFALQTGAITLPQNSSVSTAQVQAQIQQRINQLQAVQLQLLRSRR